MNNMDFEVMANFYIPGLSSELRERIIKYAKVRNMIIPEYIDALVTGDGYARDSLKKLEE